MNRQNRRHATHPLLPMQQSSKQRILDQECPKASTVAKGPKKRKRRVI